MSPDSNLRGRGETNLYPFPSEPRATYIRADLQALRRSVTPAWQERGVMLTPEEQSEFRTEIKDLCHYLQNLTGSQV